MKEKLLSLFGMLYGGGILHRWWVGPKDGSPAYEAGSAMAAAIGGIVLVVSFYYLVKSLRGPERGQDGHADPPNAERDT